jgi:benzil reductase ((S)-benzoin forming)
MRHMVGRMVATVITGVSRGLGRALFDELAGRGHRLLALGRRFTDDQRRLAADRPHQVRLREADLAAGTVDQRQLSEFLGDGGGDGDEPAVLIHNAGVVEPIGAVGTLDPAELARSVQVNLLAPMLLTNAFLAARGGHSARVLFISSGAAGKSVGGWAAYCATKAGGEMFFTVLAEQGGVTVANVNPGVMDTDMQAVLRGSEGWFPRRGHYAALAERGELPSPESVAARIAAEHLGDL